MDRKESIFFLCVTLIVLALIYYIFKKFKGRTLPTPSPPAQTDELSISDLKFVRTLNPDKSNSESEISGYTIEYAGINYVELSRNVDFTIIWKNNIGFDNVVTGFWIEHFVKSPVGTDGAAQNFTRLQRKEFPTTTQQVDTSDYGENSVSIVSTDYSVIGDNRFKIHAILNVGCVSGNCPTIELYDGVGRSDTSHNINVSEEELGATLAMTTAQSVTYTPVVSSDNMTSISADITKLRYDISNGSGVNLHGSQSIYLIPATPGSVNDTGERVDSETFFFKYTDDQYLRHDLTKGAWNNQSGRSTGCDDACHTRGEKDNRMYIAFYNKSTTTDNNIKVQLRKTDMGYGLGTDFISSDTNGNLVLVDMSSQTSTVPELEYNNSFWTFVETVPERKCVPKKQFLNKLSERTWQFGHVFGVSLFAPILTDIVTEKCDLQKCDEGMESSFIFDESDEQKQEEYWSDAFMSLQFPTEYGLGVKWTELPDRMGNWGQSRSSFKTALNKFKDEEMKPTTYSQACEEIFEY